MKRTVTAIALVASLSAFAAPAAFASSDLSMLELGVERVFDRVGVEASVEGLSVAQLASIKHVLSEGDTNDNTKRRIEAIIAN